MSRKNPITELIDTWKPRHLLASEIGEKVETVHKWAANGRIPSGRQASVIRAAQAKGMAHINGDWMVMMHERVGPRQ